MFKMLKKREKGMNRNAECLFLSSFFSIVIIIHSSDWFIQCHSCDRKFYIYYIVGVVLMLAGLDWKLLNFFFSNLIFLIEKGILRNENYFQHNFGTLYFFCIYESKHCQSFGKIFLVVYLTFFFCSLKCSRYINGLWEQNP